MTGTNRDRPGLRQALAACRQGDTLVVTKLARLARSVPDGRDVRDIADELTASDVRLNIGASIHDPTDPTDPIGRLLFTTLSMIAEFEPDLARARTREGMAVARSKGTVARGTAQTRPEPGSPPGRALPRWRAHRQRARRTLLRHPLNHLPSDRARWQPQDLTEPAFTSRPHHCRW